MNFLFLSMYKTKILKFLCQKNKSFSLFIVIFFFALIKEVGSVKKCYYYEILINDKCYAKAMKLGKHKI